jgi:hypothetical protein
MPSLMISSSSSTISLKAAFSASRAELWHPEKFSTLFVELFDSSLQRGILALCGFALTLNRLECGLKAAEFAL